MRASVCQDCILEQLQHQCRQRDGLEAPDNRSKGLDRFTEQCRELRLVQYLTVLWRLERRKSVKNGPREGDIRLEHRMNDDLGVIAAELQHVRLGCLILEQLDRWRSWFNLGAL